MPNTRIPPADAVIQPSSSLPGRRSTVLALLWSVGTVLAALTWALEWLPHPFAVPARAGIGAVFNTSDPLVGTAFTLAVGVLGVVCASAMLRSPGRRARTPSPPLLGAFAIVAALVLVLIHGTLLAFLGYTMIVPILGWFEPGLFPAYLDALADPDLIFVLSSTLGALIWGRAALLHWRLERGTCPTCGRAHDWSERDEASTRHRALRTGRAAVRVAVIGLLVYPSLRLPWLLGIPIGLDAASWSRLQNEGLEVGVALGAAGLVGAVLIGGLVRDWGVRFPRWMAGLAGRRVPVGVAVLPAAVVAIGFIALGRGITVTLLAGGLSQPLGDQLWLQAAALVALLPAGIALAVAAAAYQVRRRAACLTCAQGEPEERPSELRQRDSARSSVSATRRSRG